MSLSLSLLSTCSTSIACFSFDEKTETLNVLTKNVCDVVFSSDIYTGTKIGGALEKNPLEVADADSTSQDAQEPYRGLCVNYENRIYSCDLC